MTNASRDPAVTGLSSRADHQAAAERHKAQLLADADAIELAMAVETSAARRREQARAIQAARAGAEILVQCEAVLDELRLYREQLRQDRLDWDANAGQVGRGQGEATSRSSPRTWLTSDILTAPWRRTAWGLDR